MTAETFLELPKSCSKLTTSCDLRRGALGSVSSQDTTTDLGRLCKRAVESKEQNEWTTQERGGKKCVFCLWDKENEGKEAK
jgi:hypothetical protein